MSATDCWPEPPHYEYAVAYRAKGQAGSDHPRALENWGTDMKGCLGAYNERIAKPLFTDVAIQMRSVTGWSEVDPDQLWKE